MCFARKLVLLGIAALAALALSAPTASAASAIEVLNDATGAHCAPCNIRFAGESHINQFGARVSSCTSYFEAAVNENGLGTVTWVGVNHPNGVCPRRMCRTTGAPPPWSITSSEEEGPNTGEMVINFCIENTDGSGDASCIRDIIVTEESPHIYNFSMHQQCYFGTAEVEGEWTQVIDAAHPRIELIHL